MLASCSYALPLARTLMVQRLCHRPPTKCGVGWSLWPRYERAGGQLRKLAVFWTAGGSTRGVRSTSTSTNVHNQRTAVFWHIPSQRLRDAWLRIVLTLVRTDDVCVRLASIFFLQKRPTNEVIFASFRYDIILTDQQEMLNESEKRRDAVEPR